MTDLQTDPVTESPSPVAPEATGTHPVRLAILGGLVALLGITGGWSMVVVVFGVVVMIFLHELGHFLAARVTGMKATEFFIGFGPKIWSFRRGEVEYGLKAIPAGAYVRVLGMSGIEDVEPHEEARAYRAATYPRRLLVAVAGSAMHFAQAIVLLVLLYAFVGVPGGGLIEERAWEVAVVADDSAAAAAGLEPGDRIQAIDGDSVASFGALRDEIAARPGDDVVLEVRRDDAVFDVPVTIGEVDGDPTVGRLGVGRALVTETAGPVTAVRDSFREFWAQSTATVAFVGDFFTPSGISGFADDVATGSRGPAVGSGEGATAGSGAAIDDGDEGRIVSIVGAVRIGADLTENGWMGFLVFFASLNITIGIFNLLPVLPLDGGHVVVATYERLRELRLPRGQRYHVDMMRLMPIVYLVFTGLVLLGVSSVYLDIVNPL